MMQSAMLRIAADHPPTLEGTLSMQYDLSMICELCAEVGFPCLDAEAGEMTIVLGDGFACCFATALVRSHLTPCP